ncbi:MAG: helix-turn-helix transcriptional regulator [Acidobacteriota bacterium]|nr:helix-turn-helix transcriptional regulator [Acidobacteriota bacterium]
MRITEAVKHMCEESGMGVVGVSQALGKSRMYLSALISRGSHPRTDTLVQIAQACGYSVELVKGDERIQLEAE